jgi:hypothetical protein
MVRGCRGSRRHGVGGRGVPPPIVSILEGSNPSREMSRLLSRSRLLWEMW